MRDKFVSIAAIIAVATTMLIGRVEVASAIPVAGDSFGVLFSETKPDSIPGVASGLFKLGAAISPGLFAVASFTLTLNTTCSACSVALDTSTLSFNGGDLGLKGSVFATHTGSGGDLHLDFLGLNDSPPTWSLTDVKLVPPSGFDVKSFSGTYAVSAVPEPSTLLLLGSGLAAFGSVAWRWRRKGGSPLAPFTS